MYSIFSSYSLLSILLWTSYSFADNVTYNWDITYVNANPDGNMERRVIGVNGQWPLLPLEAKLHDTLILNVKNSLDVPTTLHAHGLFQNGSAHMDGAAMVTQCPIPPGQSYKYVIPIQQTGTYWLHGHIAGQYVDGLRTSLVLRPEKENYNYDEEYVVMVSDWYHEEHPVLLKDYLGYFNPGGTEPVPDASLINESHDAVLKFKPGKVYRLRIINTSAMAMYLFSIDDHELEVIEVDGVDTEKFTVGDTLPIAAAQRYSVLVKAKNSTNFNYKIRLNLSPEMPDLVDVPPAEGTIVYHPSSPPFSSTPPQVSSTFNDLDLVPLSPHPVLPSTKRIDMNVFLSVLDDGRNHGTFNNITYVMPLVPTLISVLTLSDDDVQDSAVYGQTGSHIINQGEVIDLVINNYDGGAHPFHLHGHSFQVIGRMNTIYDPSNPFIPVSNPIRRDTVMVPAGGSVVIRFIADNPGVWLFHCHMEWHMQSGLATTIIEDPISLRSNLKPNRELYSTCQQGGFKVSGNAAGNPGKDLTGLPHGPRPYSEQLDGRGWAGLIGSTISAVIGIGCVIRYAISN